MRLCSIGVAFVLAASASMEAHAAPDPQALAVMTHDAKGAADTALVGCYEGSIILGETKKAFDEIDLPSGAAQGSL